tara:strand:+ start:574 stop:768 length:195 start_codon:yes stop_codon:yes gene_type:complete
MKLLAKRLAGITLAGLTIGLALGGYYTLEETNELAARGIGAAVVVALILCTLNTSTGRHQRAGN